MFEGQFMVSKGAVPENWNVEILNGWNLATHPDLPVCSIVDSKNAHIGWLLGYGVLDDELHDSGPLTLDDHKGALTDESIEKFVYSFGGRFAAVISKGPVERIYLDPAGTLALVYSVREAAVASTGSLLARFTKESHPLDEWLIDALGPDKFYPAGLTPFQGIQRLLPNHYLDLQRWAPVRHWLNQSMPRVSDIEIPRQVEKIASGIRRNIEAVVAKHTTYVGLTAGKDSRMILACSRDLLPRMCAMTFDYGKRGRLDVVTASHVARRIKIDHRVLPVTEVPVALEHWYLERIGYAGGSGKVRDFYYACKRHLRADHAFLTGFSGEVGRQPLSYKFGQRTTTEYTSASEVLDVLRLPDVMPFRQAVGSWLEGTHCDDVSAMTAQMYLELRVGCWASPHMYGTAPFAVNLTPFCHREVYAAMLALPLWYWGQHRIANDVINHQWPELASVPYDRFPGVVGLVRHAGKRIRQRAERAISSFP